MSKQVHSQSKKKQDSGKQDHDTQKPDKERGAEKKTSTKEKQNDLHLLDPYEAQPNIPQR